MPYHLFQYPVPGGSDLSDLNSCLSKHRVVSVQQHVVPHPAGATLVFVVQTVEGAAAITPGSAPGRKIDYRETLSPEDFSLFSTLRDERKKWAEAEGVPVYTIFTNEQLAALATRKPSTLAGISSIDGLGKARLEKHGPRLLTLLTANLSQPIPATP